MTKCPDCRRELVEDDDGCYCDHCGWEEPYVENDYLDEDDDNFEKDFYDLSFDDDIDDPF